MKFLASSVALAAVTERKGKAYMDARSGLLRRLFAVFRPAPSAPKVTLEDQISEVVDKDHMHRLIDALPERAYAVLLVEHSSGGDYALYGDPSFAQLVWMTENFKNYILNM